MSLMLSLRSSAHARPALACILAALGATVPALPQSAVARESCGVLSVFDLCQLAGRDLTKEQRDRIAEAYPGPVSSMLDLQQAGGAVGVALIGVEATLEQLAGVRGPKIIHLVHPDHFAALADANHTVVQLLSNGRLEVLPREAIEARYSGHALVLADRSETGPRVTLEEFDYVFGIVGVGEQVRHIFTLSNSGDAELKIAAHPACCGAPEAILSRDTVPPGESAHVMVDLDLPHSGSLLRYVALLTNDPDRPVVYLTLRGTVPADVRVYPRRLLFSGDKGERIRRQLLLKGPPDMQLLGAECGTDLFEVTLGETAQEGQKQRWTMQVALSPGDRLGEITDTLTAKTSHEERPFITIPLIASVRCDLVVAPPAVFFGFVETGREEARTMAIRTRSGSGFEVREAEVVGAPEVSVAPRRVEDARWSVQVSLRAAEPGVIDARVLLTTDVPGEEHIEVPVYAEVRPAP